MKNKNITYLLQNKFAISVISIIILIIIFYILFSGKPKEIIEEKKLDKAIKEAEKEETASFSNIEFVDMANIIYENIARYSSIQDKPDVVVTILKKMNTDLDILTLIKAYGKRQSMPFGIPIGSKITLPVLVNDELDADEIEDINNDYAQKLIKYTWK